ncbi:MAG: hypothetical protein ACK54H_11155 [Phycisphaerales bacterium]|jgi:hypothetical protein
MASQQDNKKIVLVSVAIAALGLAGALFMWQFGMFSGPEPVPQDITSGMSDAEKQDFEKNQADKQQLMKRTPPAGA